MYFLAYWLFGVALTGWHFYREYGVLTVGDCLKCGVVGLVWPLLYLVLFVMKFWDYPVIKKKDGGEWLRSHMPVRPYRRAGMGTVKRDCTCSSDCKDTLDGKM